MINLSALPNSKIEQAITNLYKTEKNRNILRDRLVGGMTYEAIIQKYYPESDLWGRRDNERMRLKIQRMADKISMAIKKGLADKEGET